MWHGPYPEIPPRTPSGVCVRCRAAFAGGDRRVPVFIVTAVSTHPGGAGRALYVARFPEFKHVACADPRLRSDASPPAPRRHLYVKAPADVFPDIEPRWPSYICARKGCHKEFRAGDRVVQAYILAGIGVDPGTGQVEAVATANFEVVHESCADPQLAGTGGETLILLGPTS